MTKNGLRNLKFDGLLDTNMAGPKWVNTYNLSNSQIEDIDRAEDAMEMLDLNKAEEILKRLISENPSCVPVLSLLGHLHGRYLSDYPTAIGFYDRVLAIEPDNPWARDERRRYRRYSTY